MAEEEKKEQAEAKTEEPAVEEKPQKEDPPKEAPQEEAKKEASQQEPAEKGEAKEEVAKPSGSGGKKKKKISGMTLQEIDAKLQEARKQMGRDHSDYVQHLLARKQALSSQ